MTADATGTISGLHDYSLSFSINIFKSFPREQHQDPLKKIVIILALHNKRSMFDWHRVRLNDQSCQKNSELLYTTPLIIIALRYVTVMRALKLPLMVDTQTWLIRKPGRMTWFKLWLYRKEWLALPNRSVIDRQLRILTVARRSFTKILDSNIRAFLEGLMHQSVFPSATSVPKIHFSRTTSPCTEINLPIKV